VELRFPPEPLLLGGVAGAAEHFGQRMRLEPAAVNALTQAAERACQSTFGLLTGDLALLRVVIEEFADRVEITIEHQGEALPSAGLDTFLDAVADEGASDEVSGMLLMSLVDRVQYETVAGTQRTTLIKYAPSAQRK
jgi:hypothetical protein